MSKLERVLRYWCHIIPERYRDDALQEARIAQWLCESAGKPERYVTLRAKGALLDYISFEKAAKRGGTAQLLPFTDDEHGRSDPEPMRDTLEALQRALDPKDWQLISDRWLKERTARETAKELGMNTGRASHLTDRALVRAREVLTQDGP